MKVATPIEVLNWFNKRGIDEKTLERFDIHWDGQKIVLPIKNISGGVVFNKYRRSPMATEGQKYWYDKGGVATMFNPGALKNEDVILTEGELDAVLLETLGYHACSSTGGAQSFQLSWAPDFLEKNLSVCYDADEAGAKGAVKVGHMIPHAKMVAFPDHFAGKDVTDFITTYSSQAFQRLVELAFVLPPTIDECIIMRRKLKAESLKTDILEEHLKHLNWAKAKKTRPKVAVGDVKMVPMTNFLEFGRDGFMKCPFHVEKTGSFKYYPKDNTAYCYGGCGGKDVIDVVRLLHNCTFNEAIKILKS